MKKNKVKLLIEIAEKDYSFFKVIAEKENFSSVAQAIANGTVIKDEQKTDKISLLPMVYNTLDEAFRGGYDKGYAMGLLKGSADRPKGEWGKWIVAEIQCPNCFNYFEVNYSAKELNKCPSCGIVMRGDQ